MHHWGDEDFDWNEFDKVVRFIGDNSIKYGRLGGQCKEKFGELRFYANFGNLNLHTLIYPRFYFSQFPGWLWKLDVGFIAPFLEFVGLNSLFCKYQKFVYKKVYIKACKKWPQFQAEILGSMDRPEFIPQITKREGNKLHIMDLQGNTVSTWTTYGDKS